MPLITEIARAKINLTLHAGAAQKDGYHPLHSLVVFADIGDELSAKPSDKFSLSIEGPFAKGLSAGSDNLILRAAQGFAAHCGQSTKLAYTLAKNLPISSGIGGGSADAGAAIRLLESQNKSPNANTDKSLPLTNNWGMEKLGADIPVCHQSMTCLMEGIGEEITPLPNQGQVAAILVNPNTPVSTAKIFAKFDQSGTSSKFKLKDGSLLEMAKSGRNDLQNIAIGIAPVIQAVLKKIMAQEHCQLARMSGSGATCFGLFDAIEQAQSASIAIKDEHPDWWVAPTMLGDIPQKYEHRRVHYEF